MPRQKKGSSFFPVFITVLLVGGIVWGVFFRNGGTEPEASAKTTPPQPEVVLSSTETANTPEEVVFPTPPPEEISAPPLPEEEENDMLIRIQGLCSGQQWLAAREEISALFLTDMPDDEREEMADLSQKINQKLLNGAHPKDPQRYEVRPGDSLWKIAKRFPALHASYGPILLVNQMKSPKAILRMGQKLRIPTGTWSIVVDKSLFTLWLCYEGVPFKGYKVGIGKEERTPSGIFHASDKTPKPAWYPPHEIAMELKKKNVPIPVPSGHVENPLGTYWIALKHDLHTGLGIHGNNELDSLGTKSSLGCVRMDNKEIYMIAWTAYPGMTVTIVE